MKGLSLSLITVVMLAGSLAIDAQTNQPSLVVVCDGGSTKGIFTQVGPDGYETGEDRSTLDRIIYAFDAPREGAVRITYGEKEVCFKRFECSQAIHYVASSGEPWSSRSISDLGMRMTPRGFDGVTTSRMTSICPSWIIRYAVEGGRFRS